MTATVLLTGAGGFVVRHVAAAIAARGVRVVLVDRHFDADALQRWRGRDVRFVTCAAHELDAHVDEPVDSVVHGAAVTATPAELGWSPEAYVEHELAAALAVWRWAAAAGVRRCVFISSAGVFGGHEADVLDETVTPQPQSHYGRVKLLVEGVLADLRHADGRDACSVRLGDVYGVGERARPTRPQVSLVRRMLDAAVHEGVVTARVPSRIRAWSHAPDVGAAVDRIIAAPRLAHGLYHLTASETHDELGLAEVIGRLYPAVRRREVPAPAAAGPVRGRFAATRFGREFPDHAWTPLALALPHLREQSVVRSPGAAA